MPHLGVPCLDLDQTGHRPAGLLGSQGPQGFFVRPGGRDGAPARSGAWTAAAMNCAVSASTMMFLRSRTQRTTCPACDDAWRGPMVAREGPVASGSAIPGTVEETVPARLLDKSALQRLSRRSPGSVAPGPGPAGDLVENRSICNTRGTPGGISQDRWLHAPGPARRPPPEERTPGRRY
jgi:hypothetical protein